MKRIFSECGKDMDTLYLDGSKFEANANKYKFVWKPTTLHLRLSEIMHLEEGLPNEGVIPPVFNTFYLV
ncbi:hypothetical protein [Turicimonas muris]|uniref:hypothetical protein n=1 Tax=Turicimonas muris TaxID=1796652 RepID=UPI0024952CC6|nr:hypothetical protein [Turicimonas muris]